VKGAIPQRAAAATLDLVVMEVDNPTRYFGGYRVRNSKILRLTHDANKEKASFWEQVDIWRYLR
jgi:hypothetical protein